jgi:trans-aconitate methyltransferase
MSATTLASLVPFNADESPKIIVLGAGDGAVVDALLARFPHATLTVLESTESGRREATARLAPAGERVRVAAFDLSALDWWDRMFGADVVVASQQLSALNDPKKQYLYKAAADRLSARGILLVADALEPGQLLHHLIWLRHAGFTVVDCFWRDDRLAIFGGLKPAAASAPPLPADN